MKTKALSLIYIIILLFFSNSVDAKDFYWIGGSGKWKEPTHWSDQPGGKMNTAGIVPNFRDNVYFDEHSFPKPGAELIINDAAKCANMDWSKVTNNPTLKSDDKPSNYLSIYGSLKLSPNMLLDLLKPLYFNSSTQGHEIDFAGHAYNEDIHFSKNGGWVIKTPLKLPTHDIYFKQGNLSFESDVTCARIIANNPISRTWNLNNSTVYLTGAGSSVLHIDTQNLNFDQGKSKFILSGIGATIEITGNTPIHFNDIEFKKKAARILNENISVNFNDVTFLFGGRLKGANTFENLTFTKGNAYQIHNGADQTVLNSWIAIGSCSEHISISGENGTGSIVAKNIALDYLKIKNIAGAGSASPFSSPNSFDLGGLTGWNITAPTPKNYIWVGGTDNKWHTPSNWNANCVPSRIDNATINGDIRIEIDLDSECKDLTLSDDVTLLGSNKLNIYGSLSAGNANWEFIGTTHFKGDDARTIAINKPFKADVYFSGMAISTFNSDFRIPDHNLHLTSGHIVSDNNKIEISQFISIDNAIRSLNLGTSTLQLNSSALKTWHVEGRSFSIVESDYTINLIAPKSEFFNNLSYTIGYNKVHFTDDREQANLTNEGAPINFNKLQFSAGAKISGNHNFDIFILSAGKTYLFKAGSQQKIITNNGFIAEGTCSEYIYLKGNGGISHISSDVNTTKIKYVKITDLEVIGSVKSAGGLNANSSFGISNYNGWNIKLKTKSENFVWKGTEDSDWFNPKNWSPECVPTRLDNVLFNQTNVVAGGSKTITVNGVRKPECHNMIWENANTLAFEGACDLNIFGNLDFTSLLRDKFTFNGIINFNSKEDVNINFDQVILSNDVHFEGAKQEDGTWLAGNWKLSSDFETSGKIKLERGTLNSNNFNITAERINSNYSDNRKLQLGSSTLNLDCICLTPLNLSLEAGTSEIIIKEDGKVEVTGGDETLAFNKVTFEKTSGTALFAIHGENVSFKQIDIKSNANFLYKGFDVENLILNQGKTYKFADGETYNIGDITAVGACEGTIDIGSLSVGAETTFNSKNGNPINVSLVNMLDVHATPASLFTANNSIDLGNNDGWTFASTPTTRKLYWVGGSGKWDEPIHWSTTTGGTPGACIPTVLDNVFFDVNSFSDKNQSVSSGNSDIRCKTMDWRGSEGASPILQIGDIDISGVYIYGSFILNENLTINLPDVDFYFRSTEKNNSLTLHDFEFPKDVIFDGLAGEWILTNTLNIEGNLKLNNGALISAGNDISCNYFESTNSEMGMIRTLDIQNSTVTIHGYENGKSIDIFTADMGANETFNLFSDNSQIIIKSAKSFNIGGGFKGKYTFNSILFEDESSFSSQNTTTRINNLTYEQGGELKGTLDIGTLSLNKGTKPNTFKFEDGTNFPIEEFIALGSCNFPISIQSSKTGKQAKLEVKKNIQVDFTELTDIEGIASAVNYIASNSLEHENVINWTVNAITGIDLYWVGNGLNDEWSNHKNWSKSSGGISEGCIPTELDNVIFDSKSFLGSKIVLVNSDAKCHNINWADNVDPASIFKVQNELDIHGSLNFSEQMTLEMSGDLKFLGDGLTTDKPINFAGKTLDSDISFDGKDQSWFLQSDLSTTGDLALDNGSLNTKKKNLSIASFSSLNAQPTASRKLDISGSRITVTAEKYMSWSMIFLGSPLEFKAINSELYFPKKGSIYCESSKDLIFGDAIFDGYGKIEINKSGTETGKGTFKTVLFRQQGQIFGDHTIATLEFTLGFGENTIQAGKTINLTKSLIMEGVNCSSVQLKSSKDDQKAFINSTQTQFIYHASLENIEMTDGKTHRVSGSYNNIDGSSKGWSDARPGDGAGKKPSFIEKYDTPVVESCNNMATLSHITHFPINERTTFKWAYSPDGILPYIDETDEISAIIAVKKSGFYQVELNYNDPTDPDGCKLYSIIQVVMNAASDMTIKFKSTNVQCYGNNDGFIEAQVNNGKAPYTFFWKEASGKNVDSSDGALTGLSQVSKLSPGKYFVKVVDDNKCDYSSSKDVFNAYQMLINKIEKIDLKCNNVSNGQIDIDATGGTGALSYYLNKELKSASITGLSADDYLVHIQDVNGCKTDEKPVKIESPEPITFDFLSSPILCAEDKSGSIDPQAKGGIAPYTYKWSATNDFKSTLPAITGLNGGVYTVEVSDANNCLYPASFDLIEPEKITLSDIDLKNAKCFGEATGEVFVQANKGTAPYEYTIDALTNITGQFKNLKASSYSLIVTDKNKCSITKDLTIKEPIKLGFAISDHISPTCNNLKNGIINIVPYGGNNDYTFSWSGPNDFRAYTKNNKNLDFGEYTILLKDQKECAYEGIVNLKKDQPLQLGLVLVDPVSKSGAKDGCFRLEILGGKIPYTFNVTGPNGFSKFSPTFFDEDKAVFQKLSGGLYTITINDKSSCKAITKKIMLPENDLLITKIIAQKDVSCPGFKDGKLDADATGGNGTYDYSWSGPTGFVANTKSISNLLAGTYILTVQSNGQTATDKTVIVEPTPVLAKSIVNNVTCFNEPNGSIELEITGGTKPYSILWNGARGLFSHADKIYNLAQGDYEYKVNDANGCPIKNTVTINQPDIVSIDQTHKDITKFGLRDGSITATATGGMPPYTIFISGPNKYSKKDFNNSTGKLTVGILEQGVYIIEVLDANDCRAITETRIFEPEKLIVSLKEKTEPICHGGDEGSIEILIEDGSGDFTLNWTADNHYKNTYILNTTHISKIENLKAGNYTLTLTDNTTKEIIKFKQEVKEPAPVEIEFGVDKISCFGKKDGLINIYPKGGTPNYSYKWTGDDIKNAILEDQDNLGEGVYKVKVSDSKKCESIEYTFNLKNPEEFAGTQVVKEPLCFGDRNGEVKLNISRGADPCVVNWNTGAITHNLTNLKSGTYECTVIDNEGCSFNEKVILSQPNLLVAEISSIKEIECYGTDDGEIKTTVSGGSNPLKFNWSNGETTDKIDNLRPKKYDLIVTDKNGCEATASALVKEPEKLEIKLEAFRPTVLGTNDGSIFSKPIGGVPDYIARWEKQVEAKWEDLLIPELKINDLDRGKYKLTIDDANGCQSDTIVNLEYLYDRIIEIPKAFTPNSDGYNDDWDILRIEYIQRVKIVIYDRLGATVYKFSGTGNEYKGNRWKGRSKNSELPIGSYYYAVEADDSKPLTGTVTIAR